MSKRLIVLKPRLTPMDVRTARPAPKQPDAVLVSSAWQQLVERAIQVRGRRCERCGKTHEDDGAPVKLIGDHIHERRDGGAELDPANVQLLCARAGGDGRQHADGASGGCHARKTSEARRRRLGGL
ncbi:5-methylcytosine-specific restriction endonuclease McrA [Azospirillum agricola]|uniref:HNH endonuclease signature motif containing protein n=1 Tax=Azospirillum agricola TaxID=1720247 RepID=UPI001AE90CE1|nr:HNH endonuclease signature motif containing protein [Azospirillum agricola]MBP2233096.1 5-methylcytosine-specific restriction endonuclease McrA [Azospirillum agricola]